MGILTKPNKQMLGMAFAARDLRRSAGNESTDMKEARPEFPTDKISATFLEFLSPVLEVMNDPNDDQETESILMLGCAIWNAVVYADAVGDDKPLAAINEMMTDEPHTRPLVERLITRKRDRYPHDNRLIGKYKLNTADGDLRLRVEAWSPYPD